MLSGEKMTTELSDEVRIGESPTRRSGVDVWTALAAAVAATFVVGATRPLADPDVWWHVRTGDLILGHGIPRTEPWAYTALGRHWTPTSWLSDVIFAAVHTGLGWRGLILLKVALGTLLLVSLARLLFRDASARLAAPVFILVALTLSPFIAERPQLISLCLVVWLTSRVRNAMLGGGLTWWFVPVTYLWANLHGMWILAPLCLLLVAVCLAADHRPGWHAGSRKAVVLAVITVAASALTPAGPRLTVAALAVRRAAAADVSEWQPTNLLNHFSIFLLILFLLWVLAVARTPSPAPRSELIWMGALFVFMLTAARNVAPVAILVSPFVLIALERAYGPVLARSPSEPRLPRAVAWVVPALCAAIAATLIGTRPPLVDGLPSTIVAELKARPDQVRVLNSYVIGGYLTGEGAPQISVAIDGRTENYDPGFVHRYFLATNQMVGWRHLLSELHPDVAVIGKDSQLATELERQGWKVTTVDGDFVLLDRPGART
jgi:hypothetical protein